MPVTILYRADLDRPLTSLEADENNRRLAAAIDAGGGGSGGGIGEAPDDGLQYARQSNGWTVVVSSGLEHPQADGQFRASRNGGWETFVPGFADAPSDGSPYARRNGAWVVTGVGFVRHLGEFASSMAIQKNDLVTRNGMTWIARDSYGTNTPPPSFVNSGYWHPLGFPTAAFTEASSVRLLHEFFALYTPGRNEKLSFFEIFNNFENRIKAAETKLADHEARIAALE